MGAVDASGEAEMNRQEQSKIRELMGEPDNPIENWHDQDLQLALAKMLPDKISVIQSDIVRFIWNDKTDTCGCLVLDTEWCHVCWLVRSKYELPVLVGSNEPWQEQARHILRHIKAREIILESK